MIIITQASGGTFNAQVRTTKDSGFKVLYRASCTMGHEQAAKAVVRKYFGVKAADSVTRIPDKEIPDHMLTGNNRRRCNPVTLWSFRH